MTEDNVSVRQMNAFEQVIEGIDAEIAEKKAELNGLSSIAVLVTTRCDKYGD